MTKPWIGVDLDGTLALYDGWIGYKHIGLPIEAMLERVKGILEEGEYDIKIFTARVCDKKNKEDIIRVIEDWCEEHIGQKLEVTNEKDFGMVDLWDDRCRRVITNTGNFCCEAL